MTRLLEKISTMKALGFSVREIIKTTEGQNQKGNMKFKAPYVPKSAKTKDIFYYLQSILLILL